MIKKAGKINKSRGNIVLTIGKEEVKKNNLDSGDFIILTPEEYDNLKTSSEIEVSKIEVMPDDDAVIKLEYDLKEAKSKEKILFDKVEELEKINLNLTTQISKFEEKNYILSKENNLNSAASLSDEIKKLNDKIQELNNQIHDSDSERIELLEDMNILKTKMSFDASELARLREREDKFKEIFELLLKTNKTILEETVNKTLTATIHEINAELSKTSLLRRIRGLTIVKEPDIDKFNITNNSYLQLEEIIPQDYFLEENEDFD